MGDGVGWRRSFGSFSACSESPGSSLGLFLIAVGVLRGREHGRTRASTIAIARRLRRARRRPPSGSLGRARPGAARERSGRRRRGRCSRPRRPARAASDRPEVGRSRRDARGSRGRRRRRATPRDPRLNAAIRTSPRAVRPIDTEPRRTTSALGDGRIPPANASATRPRRESGPVGMRMVVPVSPALRERMDPRDEQRGAETERDESGGEPQPRVDAFGREDAFRGEDQEAEAEHRRGVHHRDRGADGGGLPERAVGCRSGTRRSATSRDRGRANGSAPTPIATAIIKAIEAR